MVKPLPVLTLALALALPHAPQKTTAPPRPTVLQAAEGERRVLRAGKAPLILKIDPKNTGSQHMIFGWEDIPPGDGIPTHHHLDADEIVFIHKGTATVTLGDREYEAHEGAVVFIPKGTWIGVRNKSQAPMTMVFAFPQPGFEEFLRSVSAPEGGQEPQLSATERARLERQHHIVYKRR